MQHNRDFWLRVRGTSMMPTLQPGDVCHVQVEPSFHLRAGDIVIYWRKSRPVVHRIVFCWRGWIIARGDNQACPDPPVARQAILGRVVSAERNNRCVNLHTQGWPRYLYMASTWAKAILTSLRRGLSSADRRLHSRPRH